MFISVTALKLSGYRTGRDRHTDTRTQPFIVKDRGYGVEPESMASEPESKSLWCWSQSLGCHVRAMVYGVRARDLGLGLVTWA